MEKDGAKVRVMAGNYQGVEGPVYMRNPGMLFDVTLAKGATFSAEVNPEWNGFAYICAGAGKIGGVKGKKEQVSITIVIHLFILVILVSYFHYFRGHNSWCNICTFVHPIFASAHAKQAL